MKPSRGWASGGGVYVTTNPESWLFMFEPDGIYETVEVDIWAVNVRGYILIPDDNETANPKEEFHVQHLIPPERLALKAMFVRSPNSIFWREVAP